MEQMTICNEFRVVDYYGTIFSSEQANRYFGLLRQDVRWEKDEVIIIQVDNQNQY